MWNAVTYFQTLATKLKATKTNYSFCRVSGINHLEDVLANGQRYKAFFAVDDSDDGATIQKGGGYFNRRAIVIYILKKYKITDMADRETALNECRSIHKSILTKLIKDSNDVYELTYLDKSRIPYHEVPGMFAVETAGLYFILTIEEPIELVYDATEWES